MERHEFGHALGLGHSSSINGLMWHQQINPPAYFCNDDEVHFIETLYSIAW